MNPIVSEIVFWTWCLPQTVLGLAARLVKLGDTKGVSKHKEATTVTVGSFFGWGGMALGRWNFIVDRDDKLETIEHEYGHTLQGFMLGPLYLVVVGIPSIALSLSARANPRIMEHYLDYWPESWAERLARKNN